MTNQISTADFVAYELLAAEREAACDAPFAAPGTQDPVSEADLPF